MARGELMATWSIDVDGSGGRLIAERVPQEPQGSWRLSGVRRLVPDPAHAHVVLLDAQTADGSGLFVVPLDQDGVTVTAHWTIDLTRRHGVLQLDGVSVDAVSRVGQEASASSWPAAAGVVVQCAESVGAGARLLELTVEHAQHRRQFGRAIGSFQALKHRMADMRIAVQAARAAMRYAAWSMELGRPDAERAVHVAKQWIGESMSALAGEALADPRWRRLHLGARPAPVPAPAEGQ